MWSWKGGVLLLKLVCLLVLTVSASAHGKKVKGVKYDGRSLIINGKRELLFSGSIHYPRSTPEMWPDLIAKSKQGGLNVIQTYVFWNVHEPIQGQYNFEGRYDIVKFIKMVWEQGLYVTLRIGPFIQGEWNYGGFPYWLREVNNITFRTDNPPFKYHMRKFTKKIVEMMKKEKLYASQGGPIILSQIENEYNTIQLAFKERGAAYVQWAGNMAVNMKTGVPWVMCKQKDAPGPVINACNGRNCGDTFLGPNKPNKPILWTENWTQQYRVFGDPPSQRSAEDIAYAVARFFSKNGTLTNYYMYHGGTNFGRTASAFVTTRYYDEAPLDEYGFPKEPKYGHLRDLHHALRLCRKPLFWGTSSVQIFGKNLEAIVYEKSGSSVCSAFLTNNDKRMPATVTFRGAEYYLPARSISILPDCKNVVFNTQQVISQHNIRDYHSAPESNKNLEWEMYQEMVPTILGTSIRYNSPLEHMNLTKDTTDYVWYTTSLKLDDDDLPFRPDIVPVIQVHSFGHAVHVFVNNVYIGSGHGDKIEKSFTFKNAAPLKSGTNHISLLSMTIGFPDSGVYLEHRLAGIDFVMVQGLNTGTLDLSENWWGHKVGMYGEKFRIFSHQGEHRVKWSSAKGSEGKPLMWYKTYFNAPHGDDPVAIDLSSMAKGQVWVNGQSIGRYWVSYLSPLGRPSQTMYYIPRSFLKPTGNLLVVFEETGGEPEQIRFTTVNRDTVCSYISEFHLPHVKSWARKNSEIQPVAEVMKPHINLNCPDNKVITKVKFASFGNPHGVCGYFVKGSCHYPNTKSIVKKACLGKSNCHVQIQHDTFGGDKCPGITKTLAAQVRCGPRRS